MILAQVPLDRGEQSDHVLLADLHRPAQALERGCVGGEPADEPRGPDDQPGPRGPAQCLAAAEQDGVRAGLAEAPEVVGRWQLRGGIDDDRDTQRPREPHDGLERQHGVREVRLRDVEDGGC